jgi:hypothetical protein
MKSSAVVWSLIVGLSSFTVPLHAQRIEAGVMVRSGPIASHVIIRDGYSTYHDGYSTYRRPTARRVVVVERPRTVTVERTHRHRAAKHWSRHGYRRVILYYWDGRYYDRVVGHRRDVRTIVVWERDGHYYRDCDDDHRPHHDHWDD